MSGFAMMQHVGSTRLSTNRSDEGGAFRRVRRGRLVSGDNQTQSLGAKSATAVEIVVFNQRAAAG